MASVVRSSVLIWADLLAGYALWVMITYLTNVWNISFTHAAWIVNTLGGIATIMPIGFAFLVDTLMGNYLMLLLSSIAYSIGLGFLSMSTPPVLSKSTGTCSEYKPECIGHTQRVLFYTALALIAVGISGHLVSLEPFFEDQSKGDQTEDNEAEARKNLWRMLGIFSVFLVPIIGGIALQYIHPWSIRFGIPAICTLVATLLFVSGSFSYKYNSPQGSPLTTVCRVFVASASKILQALPNDANQLYEKSGCDPQLLHHTSGLRCLDKAAIILPTTNQEQEGKNRWRLCRITEVEETKIAIRMIPMWLTFIICGVVISIGNTYFVEQANHMNPMVGHLKVPLPFFLALYDTAKFQFAKLYGSLKSCLGPNASRVGILVAMTFSILCCITAAKVETRRLEVIRRHDFLDKPEEQIPMTRFWLLPQFVLLAALDQISVDSIGSFFSDQAPPSMKNYSAFFTKGVSGLGTLVSVLLVYVMGKISEMGGKSNWFQHTLNRSRLDNYYWTLAALSAVNLVLYILVACFYVESFREPEPANVESAAS